jgi:hypothetical protein
MKTVKDLYRSGNTTSNRMGDVRPLVDEGGKKKGDIEIVTREGVEWVVAGTGGVSTFTTPRPPSTKWWKLPAESEIPDQLEVTEDTSLPGHYLWEPKEDMTLAQYKELLTSTGPWEKNFLKATEGQMESAETTLSPAFAGLSVKVARLLLPAVEAIHQQHNAMIATASEDDASDLANDAALYALIIEQLRLRLSQPVGRTRPSR